MKNLTFYEVNENTTLPEMTETEGNVFDAINNAGAITERGLTKQTKHRDAHQRNRRLTTMPKYPSPSKRTRLGRIHKTGTAP